MNGDQDLLPDVITETLRTFRDAATPPDHLAERIESRYRGRRRRRIVLSGLTVLVLAVSSGALAAQDGHAPQPGKTSEPGYTDIDARCRGNFSGTIEPQYLQAKPALQVSAGDDHRGVRVYANEKAQLTCMWAPDTPPWVSGAAIYNGSYLYPENLYDWGVEAAEPGDVGVVVGMTPPGATRIDLQIDGRPITPATVGERYFAYAGLDSMLRNKVRHVTAYWPDRALVAWSNYETSHQNDSCDSEVAAALAQVSGLPNQ